MAYILADLNTRDSFVTTSTDVMLYDTKVIVQSVWRLITTDEGEIPNFRNYGLSVKKFLQYPLTEETAKGIYNYVKDRVTIFEDRAEVIRADVDADFDRGMFLMSFYIRAIPTNEVVKLPVWNIQVSTL